MNDYRDNIEIDLKDLFVKILAKWKLIILCVVIGAVLGGVYGYIRGGAKEQEPETNIAKLEDALSDKEIMEVRRAVNAYLGYKKLYDDAKTYQDRSILMSIDTNQAPIAMKMYQLSDYDEPENYISGPTVVDDIVALYQNMLYEDDVAGAVVLSVDSVVNREYAKELYSVYKTGKSMLVLQANGTNKQEAMTMLEAVSEKLIEKSSSVRARFPHRIEEVSTTFQLVYDDSIKAKKLNLISSMDSLNKSMIGVPSSLTAAQKSYFTALIDENGANFGVERQEVVLDETGSLVKYIFLGAVGLAFLVFCAVALKYILSANLRTTDDLRTAFGLPVIGCIKTGSQGEFDMLSFSIAAGAKKEDVDAICLIGTAEGTDVEEKKSQLIANLDGKSINALSAGDILKDTDSVEKVTQSKGVVLLEKIGVSAYEDIARELELCKNYGVKVLGAIVMQ